MQLRHRVLLLRLVLPLILMSATGCSVSYEGERAETGECPPDEVCSPLTPGGLYFYGAEFADRPWFSLNPNSLPPTAVGGSQTITVHTAGDREPLDYPFTATVTGESLVIQSTALAEVVLFGARWGSGTLRLTDFTDRLFDRVEVRSESIVHYVLGPANEEIGLDEDRWAMYPGSTARVVGRIYDSSYHRLVDETLQIYPVDASTLVSASQDSWDSLTFETMADATQVDVVIHSGDGGEHIEAVGFQDWIDEVTPLYGDVPWTLPEHSTWLPICFEARGDITRVFGVPWQIWVTGDATMQEEPYKANCVQITTGQAGDLWLSVEVLSIAIDYAITVTPAIESRRRDKAASPTTAWTPPAPRPPVPRPPVPGWRASAQQ